MRSLARVLVGFATAGLVFLGLWVIALVVGGSDCYSGECNVVGEAVADGTGRWLLFLAFVAAAVGLGLSAARAVR
jgi:hypothetical protein